MNGVPLSPLPLVKSERLARSFVLLSDVYVKLDRKMEAKQYLLSLQQNYQADDDIAGMIESRLEKLKSVK